MGKKIKKTLFKHLLISLLGVQMLLTSSCTLLLIGAAASAAVLGTAWYLGELTGEQQATPKQVETATLEAFKTLKIDKQSVMTATFKSKIVGKNKNGDSVKVQADLQENGGTKISIRIGAFGDRAASEKLYLQINENLKKLVPKKK